jgi:hypothetical protein
MRRYYLESLTLSFGLAIINKPYYNKQTIKKGKSSTAQTTNPHQQFTITPITLAFGRLDMNGSTQDNLAIKAVCVIGFINASQMIHLIFSPMTKQIGASYPTYFMASVLLSAICLIGLWFLKKWAALAYAAVLLINQLVLMKMGFWEVTALIIPVLIIGLLYNQHNNFT